MSLIFLPPKKSENQILSGVFRGYNKRSVEKKWINKISSLHLKVPQKVPGILLNFYTELASELDQDLLFLTTSTVSFSSLEEKS